MVGLLRLFAAILLFCVAISPPIVLSGSAAGGPGLAWAGEIDDADDRDKGGQGRRRDDDDDHDDDDDDDDDHDDDNDDDHEDDNDNDDNAGNGVGNGIGNGRGNGGGESGDATVGDNRDRTSERWFGGGAKIVGAPAVGRLFTIVDWSPTAGASGGPGGGTDWRQDADKATGSGDALRTASVDTDRHEGRAEGPRRRYPGDAVGDELLVMGISPDEMQALEQAGFRLVDRSRFGALGLSAWRFSVPPGRSLASALRLARSLAPDAILEPNFIYRSAGPTAGRSAGRAPLDVCQGRDCYGYTLIGWEQVANSCGAGIRIGMTDTGIDPSHPALRDREVRTEVFDPYGDGSMPDHGTAVAGLLVGNADSGFPGMLPGAELFAADVFHTDEAGESYSTLLSLVQGLDWLVESGVSVVNVSMTGPANALLEATVKRMNELGVIVVAAAGNGGPTAPPAFPAAYEEVVSVTAVDQDLRPYSMANRGAYISFSSPGVHIWSAGLAGSGQHRTGTSFAAAHASAIIADVIREGGPADSHDALRVLQTSAHDLGAPGKDPVFGWGLIHGTPACRI